MPIKLFEPVFANESEFMTSNATIAYDAVTALDAVPCKLPVNDVACTESSPERFGSTRILSSKSVTRRPVPAISCKILCQDIFLLPEAEPDGWSFIKNFVCDVGSAISPIFTEGKLAVTLVS